MSVDELDYWHVVTPGTWPDPPCEMSVSAETEINECPRRWALGAAQYPDLWSGAGYPPKFHLRAMEGTVVHSALQIITKKLTEAGIESVSSPDAVRVLRELGGLSLVIRRCIDNVCGRYANNPRATGRMGHVASNLRAQVPTIRMRLQAMLNRVRLAVNPGLPASVHGVGAVGGSPTRRPLAYGTYAELEVCATDLGWKGIVDLLAIDKDTCEIIEYKTGSFNEHHKSQILAYAALWRFDEELNPSRRVADRLSIVYENQTLDVPPPSSDELHQIARELRERREVAEDSLREDPPTARPSASTCRYCGVRQLCQEYWNAGAPRLPDEVQFGDIEVEISECVGPMSWDAQAVSGGGVLTGGSVLLRLHYAQSLQSGMRIRLIDVGLTRETEGDFVRTVATMTSRSELYICKAQPRTNAV